MLNRDMFDNGKSQAGSARFFGSAFVHPVKTFEYPILVVWCNTDAGVGNNQQCASFLAGRAHCYTAAGMVIADGIVTEVEG